jgi:hypothetical protein
MEGRVTLHEVMLQACRERYVPCIFITAMFGVERPLKAFQGNFLDDIFASNRESTLEVGGLYVYKNGLRMWR